MYDSVMVAAFGGVTMNLDGSDELHVHPGILHGAPRESNWTSGFPRVRKSRLGVGQHRFGIPFWLVGEFTTH